MGEQLAGEGDHGRYEFEPLLDPKYLVLGYLNEYLGRDLGQQSDDAMGVVGLTDPTPAEREQIVERFFVNEAHVVEGFCDGLRDWATIEGADFALDVIRSESGHTSVHSARATSAINVCYAESSLSGPFGRAEIHEGMFPEWEWRTPSKDCIDARFSYLMGCHRRFGNGVMFQFANASHKVDLLVWFLKQVGCPWTQVQTWNHTIPNLTRVHFEPTPTLARWLSIDEGWPSPRP